MLPFKKTIKTKDNLSYGKDNIDSLLKKSVARSEEKINSGMKYLSHGSEGIAYHIKNRVIKYTNNIGEAKSARYFLKNPTTCIVKIYSVKLIQNKPKVWRIESEKVRVVEPKQTETYEYQIGIRNIKLILRKKKLQAFDIHSENIGWTKNKKLVLLDLGYIKKIP